MGKGYGTKILNFGRKKKILFVIKGLSGMCLKIIVDGFTVVNDVLLFRL